MEIVKEKITKENNRMLLVIKQMINDKQESQKDFNHKKGDNIKLFTFLELRLIRFSHCSVSNNVLAQGIYVINKNALIVTKRHKDASHVLYGVNRHSSTLFNERIIQLLIKNGYQLETSPPSVILFISQYVSI